MDSSRRIEWVDLAKSVCVVLVVLYHARHQTYLVDWTYSAEATEAWQSISDLLTPLRMPLFFLISGLLAARSLHLEWDAVSAKRVYSYYYLYFLWSAIFLAANTHPASLVEDIRWLAAGFSDAWYLWALATFFIIGRLTRRWSCWVPIALAAILACVAPLFEEGPVQLLSMFRCLAFFLVGLRLPHLIARLASRGNVAMLLTTALSLIASMIFTWKIGRTFNPVVDITAAAVGVMAAKLAVEHWMVLKRTSRWFAQRTLAIYLVHFVVLATLPALVGSVLPDAILASFAAALAFPIVAAIVSVAAALIVHRLAERGPLSLLFRLPGLPRSQRPLPSAPR